MDPWSEVRDPDGNTFWYNSATGAVQFTPPASVG